MSRDVPYKAWMTLLHGSLSGDLKSHPEKKLADHLCGVARLAQELIRHHDLDDLASDVAVAAYTHDLGKAEPEFQKRVHPPYRGLKTEHSAPSAFFTFTLKTEDGDPFGLFLSAEAVRRHHAKIEDWDILTSNYWQKYRDKTTTINETMKRLISDWPFGIEEKEWKDLIRMCSRVGAYQGDPMEDYWLRLRSILSLLVAGDRMDAIGVEAIDFPAFPVFMPPTFKKHSEMNNWRDLIAEGCRKNVAEVTAPGLFTLTLPTGSGKTCIGLRAAHTIAEKLGYKTIVYALPFISIVEQNAKVAGGLFGEDAVQEDHSLKLAQNENDEAEEKEACDEDDNWKRMSRLFRYWNASVVITTMVHLWEALYNPKANATMDFHRLRKAVVLLDEPQGIDSRLWRGFGETLEFLSRKWGTVFILMTATQPRIVQGTELAPPCTLPFNRHRYRFLSERHSLQELPDLLQKYTPFAQKSGMVVLNTRKSALTAYRMLKPLLGDAPVFVLTRWMTSVHRRRVLKCIKELEESGEKHYLIATQVVEAGVDLDFDWVFRDVGPLDSVIQVAGRCNRNALREPGYVLVAELCDEKGRAFSKMVYDAVLLDKTRELLTESPEFDDRDVTALVDRYYGSLASALRQQPVWENIREGKWGSYIPLFEDKGNDVPVYVDEDGTLDGMLEELLDTKRTLRNREHLKSLQNRLQQYSIGIDARYLQAWLDRIGGFVGVGEEKIEPYGDFCHIIRASGIGEDEIYHPVAGFQPPDNNVEDDRW